MAIFSLKYKMKDLIFFFNLQKIFVRTKNKSNCRQLNFADECLKLADFVFSNAQFELIAPNRLFFHYKYLRNTENATNIFLLNIDYETCECKIVDWHFNVPARYCKVYFDQVDRTRFLIISYDTA